MSVDLDGEVRAMALKTERIKVEVTDSTEDETRTFTIVLRAPNSDFQLADLLQQRGVIAPLDGELKQAVKEATQNYLSGAEVLISTLGKAFTATQQPPNNRKRKDRSTGRSSPTLASASELQGSTAGGN
jgi:hypothetical protein